MNDNGKHWITKKKIGKGLSVSQKNTNTSSARRSPSTTSSGRTTRILPTPKGIRTPTPAPLPIPATPDAGEGVAGPTESTDSAGDGGVTHPRGAKVGAVGSRRRGCSCGGEGVNGAAVGLSFVFAVRAVGVVVTGTVSVFLVDATPELENLCRWRKNAVVILRVMVPHVRDNDPRCIV